MRISDYLEHAMRSARETKEWTCRKRPGDIHPFVCAYRGDELIAITTLQDHERDEILSVASVSAVGFDADVISAVIETYTAHSPLTDPEAGINPHTGKRWNSGEMQDVALNHNGIAKGWVSEALLVTVANRAGDVAALHQSYRYSGKYLVWEADAGPVMFGGDDVPFRGIVPETLRRAMQLKSASQQVPGGWDIVDRADRDIIAAKILMSKTECAVLLVAEAGDDPRVRKLKRVGVPIHEQGDDDGPEGLGAPR